MKGVMENRSWSKPVDDFFFILVAFFNAKQGRLVVVFASKRITHQTLESTWKNVHLLEVLSLRSSILLIG